MRARPILSVVVSLAMLWGAAPAANALPKGTRVQEWATGLDFGIDMAWVKGTKKMFVTEKGGQIRVVNKGRVLERPCARLPVNSQGERGLLGITLHPRFDTNKLLYVYHTNPDPLENRVVRFTVRKNRCRNPEVILEGLQTHGASNHNAGQLDFAKGKLFVSTGDAARPSESQDTSSRLGKILRINPDGSIPAGNPFDNAVWSYGLRNPFGLAVKPGTGTIYSSDNGPTCDDELNLIKKGANYGWGPTYRCGTAGDGMAPKGPLVRWSDIIVPTDVTYYRGRLKSLSNDVYLGEFRGEGALHRIVLNSKGNEVRDDRIIHRAGSGIVDVSKGPGGWLYYMTPGKIHVIRS